MGGRQTTLSKSNLHFRPPYECQRKVKDKVYLRLSWEFDAIYFLASLAKRIWVWRSNWRLEFCAVEPFSVAADDQQAALRQVAHSKTAVCVRMCVRRPTPQSLRTGSALSRPTPHGFAQLTQYPLSVPPNTHTQSSHCGTEIASVIWLKCSSREKGTEKFRQKRKNVRFRRSSHFIDMFMLCFYKWIQIQWLVITIYS